MIVNALGDQDQQQILGNFALKQLKQQRCLGKAILRKTSLIFQNIWQRRTKVRKYSMLENLFWFYIFV